MDKPRKYSKSTYHHLYNRGANGNDIFFDRESYLYFLRRMSFYKNKFKIDIISYCLMPNHFHLFIKQLSNEYSISQFISSLLNSYTKSINTKFERIGTLFQGKTKNKIIEYESYYKWVIKYILDNPVQANLVKGSNEYEFSNAKDLLGTRNGKLTNKNEVISYFQNKDQMIQFFTDSKIKNEYYI